MYPACLWINGVLSATCKIMQSRLFCEVNDIACVHRTCLLWHGCQVFVLFCFVYQGNKKNPSHGTDYFMSDPLPELGRAAF